MAWVQLVFSALVIVFAAIQLAKYGDVIALRTRLGGMFVGVLLIAGATSLPEVLTSISALQQNAPNLAAGNLLGSNTFNMFLLAIIDISFRNQRILRKAALKHAVTGSLTVFLIGLVVFFMIANIDIKMCDVFILAHVMGSIGIGVLLIIISFFLAVKIKSLLIGQSSDSETRQAIMEYLESRPEIESVLNLITLQLGSQIMVAVKARMSGVSSVNQLIENINTCEAELKKKMPAVHWVFFEPDVRK